MQYSEEDMFYSRVSKCSRPLRYWRALFKGVMGQQLAYEFETFENFFNEDLILVSDNGTIQIHD